MLPDTDITFAPQKKIRAMKREGWTPAEGYEPTHPGWAVLMVRPPRIEPGRTAADNPMGDIA
jgi:hypothetical protein